MPVVSWHKLKQKHNMSLNLHINKTLPNFEDWQITTIFYCLLHAVDEYLAENPRNLHPIDHWERKEDINNHLRSIRHNYLLLKRISEKARYQRTMTYNDLLIFLKRYVKVIKYLTPRTCSSCGCYNRLNKGNCMMCRTPL